MLKGKVIVVGVCGGIAAYKSAGMVSKLKKLGADVHVIMTRSACEFIKPLTFQTLSQNYVNNDMFARPYTWEVEHISLAKKADMIAIVPATANIIGKTANGIADDMLSTTIMAAVSPVIFAPAMNTHMYNNPIVQENIKKLESIGYKFVKPDCGRLACGDIGTGRLTEVDNIIECIIETIGYKKDLKGRNVLVTAGPTREDIDPVRFITNHSTGKMGYAIARNAKYRGADVTLITGHTNLKPINNIKIINIKSAHEMYDSVIDNFKNADIVVKAAAVSDYRPISVSQNKIKKENDLKLELTRNPDILLELGKMVKNQVLVGFSMETKNLEEYAREKLVKKNLDLIIANDVTKKGAGFGVDTNIVKILDRYGNIEDIPIMTKNELAGVILNKAFEIYKQKN